MAWVGAIGPVCGLLLALLQWWISKSPERTTEVINNAREQGREDIVAGNADNVSTRIDRVLMASETNGSSTAGLKDDQDTQRRLEDVIGK
jgi:hypothetical protein